MKKILTALAVLVMMGCASTPVVEEDVCARLQRLVPDHSTVVANLVEENQFMYWKGAELANGMKRSKDGNACVYVNLHMMHRNITSIGEICTEVDKDGLYFIETSCDYKGGEEIHRRDHVKKKVVVVQ